MTDVNLSGNTNPSGLQIIDKDKGKECFEPRGFRESCERQRDCWSPSDTALVESARCASEAGLRETLMVERECRRETEAHGLHLDSRLSNGFDRTNDNFWNGLTQTNDHLSARIGLVEKSVLESVKEVLLQNSRDTKEIMLQACKDTAEIRLEQKICAKDMEIHSLRMQTELAKQIASCCCDTRALITSTAASTNGLITGTEITVLRAQVEKLQNELLQIFATVPTARGI